MRRRWRGRADEEGTGVVSTFVGAAIFLVCLLFAAQVLLGLYLTSVVSAVASDAARTAAGASAPPVDEVAASARRQLGAAGSGATFSWTMDDDAVRLTVRVPRPGMLPVLTSPIVRTVRVRVERWR